MAIINIIYAPLMVFLRDPSRKDEEKVRATYINNYCNYSYYINYINYSYGI